MSESGQAGPAPVSPRAPGPMIVNRPTEMAWSGISTFMKLPLCLTLFAHRCVLEAITGTAMRRIGLTEPDYVDPRAAGSPVARTLRPNEASL